MELEMGECKGREVRTNDGSAGVILGYSYSTMYPGLVTGYVVRLDDCAINGVKDFQAHELELLDIQRERICYVCSEEFGKRDKVIRLEVGVITSDNGRNYSEDGRIFIHTACLKSCLRR